MILIDKPVDWTSFGVVKKLRWLLTQYSGKKIKVGHAGTLDPFATGLLILCTGACTKKIDSYQAQNKEYVAELKLGSTTPSYDTETEEDHSFDTEHITLELIKQVLPQFVGTIEQVPPVFSAKKIDGVRAYKKARKGQEVAMRTAQVEVQAIEIMEFSDNFLRLKIQCGKGTYIRALARDIGIALNSGAYLTNLRRTRIGAYVVENALSIQEFEQQLNKLQTAAQAMQN